VGDPCRGRWIWTGVQPACVKGRPPQENPLSVAWQHWSDRDRLNLLFYLYRMQALGIPAPVPCSWAKDAETLHHCTPISEAEYLDGIVAVAHNVVPLPLPSATAIGSAMRANEDMRAAKSTADLWKVIGEYDQVIQEAPWWADAYYNRARVEAVYGLNLWAIADYERVLKLNPSPEVAADVREKIDELKQD
jgi:tetratricopeptide (TPR) repeat protein